MQLLADTSLETAFAASQTDFKTACTDMNNALSEIAAVAGMCNAGLQLSGPHVR